MSRAAGRSGRWHAAGLAVVLASAPLAATAQEVRVGFISTLTGGGALIGEPTKKG